MTGPQDEQSQRHRAEQHLIECLVVHYTPAPMTPAQCAAFDAALWQRLETRPSIRRFIPVCATLAAATALIWLGLAAWSPLPQEEGEPLAARVEVSREPSLEYAMFLTPGLDEPVLPDDSTMLPDDYQAIVQVFLER